MFLLIVLESARCCRLAVYIVDSGLAAGDILAFFLPYNRFYRFEAAVTVTVSLRVPPLP